MKAILVAGARPNFVKIAPILRALDDRDVTSTLVHSGQHYDAAMSEVFFADLGIREPDEFLGAGSGTHAEQTARIMTAFDPVVVEREPDVVVVVGDVNSTVACGLVAAKRGVRLAHVEAGLRSRDWTMPEEVNRVVTDRLSDLLFASSADAADNLRAEGYRDDQIHTVGNVMVDSLLACLDRARSTDALDRLALRRGEYGLVTLHRPANVDGLTTLTSLAGALRRISDRVPLVFPVHPRTAPMLESLDLGPRVRLVPPVGYLDFIALEDGARIVLTDSGGIQEETTVLGVPCLTLRSSTERPVTISHGSNQLVGTDPEAIVGAAERVLDGSAPACGPPELWDGHAAPRIVDVLVRLDEFQLRPTDLAATTTA